MSPRYETGMTASQMMTVTEEHLAPDPFIPDLFADGARRLSTATLHLICEMACHNILYPLFGDDDSSVGIRNDIWFWGDAAPGEPLFAEATIAAIDGRRVAFNVFVRAGIREIARGIHERMLVSRTRFMASLPPPPGDG